LSRCGAAGLRGARRQGAEPAALIGSKRLQRRHIPRRLHGGGRLPNEGGFARDFANPLAVAEILPSHHDGARRIGRANEHTRPHVKARYGPAIGSRYISRRNARIDCEAAVLQRNGPVDDNRLAEEDLALSERQDHVGKARRDEIALAHENPKLWTFTIFDDHLVGRQRFPPDILPPMPPEHPSGAPFISRNPHPAEFVIESPTAIVIGHKTPIGFLILRNPIPSVVL
jgi:hypothetical protein